MTPPKDGEGERWEGNTIVSLVLRIGVLVAVALVVAGGARYLLRYGHQPPEYGVFHGEVAGLKSLPGILRLTASGSPRGLIQLGLLVLILTPMARVLTSLILFIQERDRLYAVITAVVLAVLVLGFFLPRFL